MSETRLLVGSIGTSEYGETTYRFDGEEADGEASPVLLAQLLENHESTAGIHEAVIVHTSTVRTETDHIDVLGNGFENLGVDPTFKEIPRLTGSDDIDIVLERLSDVITDREEVSVVFDVSHSFTSLRMAFYTAGVQIAAMHDDIEVGAIYYAEEAGNGDESLIVDVTYLYTLMEWYHAIRSFKETGTLGPTRMLLAERRADLFTETKDTATPVTGQKPGRFAEFAGCLSAVSRNLDAGLPIETGLAAKNAVSALRELEDEDFIGPEDAFLTPLTEDLERFAISEDDVSKADLILTWEELDRQAELVAFYVATERYWHAVECGRELFVNRLPYGLDLRTDWLSHDTRTRITNLLGAISGAQRAAMSSPPAAFSEIYEPLTDYRNFHAHAGFKARSTPTDDGIVEVLERLCDSLDDDRYWLDLLEFCGLW